MSDEIATLHEILSLKDEIRTGWQLRGVSQPESVAAHTWGVSFLCLVYGDRMAAEFETRGQTLSVGRALQLAVVHDLAEAETGDFPTRADSTAETVSEATKERLERAAVGSLTAPLGTDQIRSLWEEYEARETPESVFVKEMDLVDMCLQALVYESERRYDPGSDTRNAFVEFTHLDEFFATAEPRLQTELGRSLYEEVHDRYTEIRDRR